MLRNILHCSKLELIVCLERQAGSGEHWFEGEQVQGHPSAAASETPGRDVNEITTVTSAELGLLVLSTAWVTGASRALDLRGSGRAV